MTLATKQYHSLSIPTKVGVLQLKVTVEPCHSAGLYRFRAEAKTGRTCVATLNGVLFKPALLPQLIKTAATYTREAHRLTKFLRHASQTAKSAAQTTGLILLTRIEVAPKFKGRGIGTCLLSKLQALACPILPHCRTCVLEAIAFTAPSKQRDIESERVRKFYQEKLGAVNIPGTKNGLVWVGQKDHKRDSPRPSRPPQKIRYRTPLC